MVPRSNSPPRSPDLVSLPVPAAPRSPRAILSRRDIGGGLWLVSLEGAGVSSYRTPGQYTWVEAEGVGGYFVLAQRLGDSEWEIILREGGGAADVLVRARPGDIVQATSALGRGFPCEETRDRALVIAVPTSAIAVARPVAQWRLDRGLAARTTLLLGAKDKSDVPLLDELSAFREGGLEVIICLSRESPASEPGYARGHVQDIAKGLVGERPLFFVAGGTKAESGVRATFPDAEIHSNY